MGWDNSVYVRGRKKKRTKVRETAASLAKEYEGKLLEPDEYEAEDEDDDGFELSFQFATTGGGFSVERLDGGRGGYKLHTHKELAGDASETIGDLMDVLGAALGTVLEEGSDEIDELLEEDEPARDRPFLEDSLRNKALVRVEDRSGVTLGKLTVEASEIVAAIDDDGKLRDLAAYPKLTEAGRASARVARVQVTLHDDYRAYRRHRWACDGRITEAKVEELSD